MKKILLFMLSLPLVQAAMAQENYWAARTSTDRITTDKAVSRLSFPKEFKLFNLDATALRQKLFSVAGNNAAVHSAIISLPNADGQLEQFEVVEASNFDPILQARFPEIRAFSGKGITDKYATLKMSISPQGIQTMVFRTEKENEFIEPYSQDHNVYAVFKSQRTPGKLPWTCSTPEQKIVTEIGEQVTNVTGRSTGDLKTMRLAQSVTAEYSNYFGATSAAQVGLVLAAVNNTLTRCNGCYEKDLAVHLNLIANTTNVFYYDPATDPYSPAATGASGAWNSEVQNTLTTVIGEANYDIGHLFGATGGGGNAGCIGCVCVNGQKGSGFTSPFTGQPPVGDNFDIDFVVHEVGHQLGANHTFSFSNELTGVNKEVGAGITIMGYAGITPYDPAPHSIDIYHSASIAQIQTNLAGKACPVTTNITANNATPVVAPLTNYTIPISTPFALTGSATDANGDPLTYCWEQNDNVVSGQTSGNSVAYPTKPGGPNWLPFPATASPTRTFPRLSTILSGLLVTPPLPGGDAICNIEALSSVPRTLNFRLTVRDNHPYSSTVPVAVAQTAFQDMTVTVASSGPFQVTTANSASTWTIGNSQAITWSVNGTDGAPINCANVKISMSTDGGNTFPIVLAASTPNDGTETITVPNNATTTGRIKVEAIGNIFFDINDANITLIAPPPSFSFNSPGPVLAACPTPATLSTTLTATYAGGLSSNINLTATVTPGTGTATLTPATLTTSTTSTTVTLTNAGTLAPGNYTVTVTGTATGATTQTRDIVFTISPLTPPITGQPVDQTVCAGSNASFTVTSPTATSFQWQISTDGGTTWNNVSGATAATYSISGVTVGQSGNKYRVIASTTCGSTTSNAVTLTVNTPVTITAQPSSVTICENAGTSFSVTATATGTITYQWQSSADGGATYANVAGATTSTLTIPIANSLANGYRYRVVATSPCGPVTSSAAILTVNTYPVISLTAVPATICKSDAAFTLTGSPSGTFSGTGVSGGSTFTPSATAVGPVTVTYTSTNLGCTATASKVITVGECPERHLKLNQFGAAIVYPSPNDGNFNIRLNTDLYSNVSVRVFDNNGREVKAASFSGLAYGSVMSVNLGHVPSGVYHVYLFSNDVNKSTKGVSIFVNR